MSTLKTDDVFHPSVKELATWKTPKWMCHSQNVARLSVALAQRIGCSDHEIQGLYLGARLHDIGKQFIPESILNKPGVLDPDEFKIIQLHPLLGFDHLYSFTIDAAILQPVLYHHERWDGSGYPYHLIKNEIPLGARICAIADVWDALTSDRCYRSAWKSSHAIDQIQAGAGTIFDAEVVRPFIELMNENRMANVPREYRRKDLVTMPGALLYSWPSQTREK